MPIPGPSLQAVERSLGSRPDLDTLRSLRAVVTSLEFADEVRSVANRGELSSQIIRLERVRSELSDMAVAKQEQHRQVEVIMLGGAAALGVGALLALGTDSLTFPLFAIAPLAVGGFLGWRGSNANHQLALEISTLHAIDEALGEHLRALKVEP